MRHWRHFPESDEADMLAVMQQIASTSSRFLPVLALSALGLSLTALAFAGWMRFGDEIVTAMILNGLATCF